MRLLVLILDLSNGQLGVLQRELVHEIAQLCSVEEEHIQVKYLTSNPAGCTGTTAEIHYFSPPNTKENVNVPAVASLLKRKLVSIAGEDVPVFLYRADNMF